MATALQIVSRRECKEAGTTRAAFRKTKFGKRYLREIVRDF